MGKKGRIVGTERWKIWKDVKLERNGKQKGKLKYGRMEIREGW